ncbi:MAG: DNA-3-methyladenine glycosylase 2 family protein [Deltaproteobacteria bacterium]|nr:DNA-3-methyladenine glycosylase 2 family protein [Deltaproteobacteria bacterium]
MARRPSTTAARRALATSDPVLGRHMEKIGRYRIALDGISSIYQALAEAVVYQQLTGKAAATIFGRVQALGGGALPPPAALLALDDALLRGAGLSRAKTAALKDLAAHAHDGRLPDLAETAALDDDALVARLTAVRGVGPWTVHMLMMFRLGRADVLPATDYGVRKGFQRVFRTRALPTPAQVLARGERWRPHRTMAAWYLWRALD